AVLRPMSFTIPAVRHEDNIPHPRHSQDCGRCLAGAGANSPRAGRRAATHKQTLRLADAAAAGEYRGHQVLGSVDMSEAVRPGSTANKTIDESQSFRARPRWRRDLPRPAGGRARAARRRARDIEPEARG